MYEDKSIKRATQHPVVKSNENSTRPWLDEFESPWWLVEGTTLYCNEWRITDDGVSINQRINWEYPIYDPITKKVTLLTNPENAELLEVAQRFCITLRDGHIRMVESASNQASLTRRVMLIFAWMRLNFIYKLDQLTILNFRLFMRSAVWGTVRLLDVESRFNDYLLLLREAGQKFPVKFEQKREHYKKYPSIDVGAIYQHLGLAPDLAKNMGKNFYYQFWNAVAVLNGTELVPKYRQHFLEMEDEPEREYNEKLTLKVYVRTWQILHDMSYILPQKCNVNPTHDFIEGERMSSVQIAKNLLAAVDLEIEEGITETIPDKQAFHIIDRACRWVLIYADDLLDLRKRAMIEASRETKWESTRFNRLATLLKRFTPKNFTKDDPGAPWPLVAGARESVDEGRDLTISEATSAYLMSACVIVIAAFTARRKMEVLTIKGGEPTEDDRVPRALYIDDFGEPWIWTYIEKTFQKWDRTPIPQVVVKAIEVLEALTESMRKRSDSRSLFELESFSGVRGPKFRVVKAINLFADFVQVPLLEDGSKWVFLPHQFRRLFSLLFMYRYKYRETGKMEVLFHQLRHFNMEMTKRYIEEIYESDMIKAHSKHVVVDLMSEVLRGKRKALGPGGEIMREHLDEMLHEVIKDSEILSGRENPVVARKIAERVMEKLDVEMVPFKWGFCYAYKAGDGGEFCGNCIAENEKFDNPNVAKATPKKCLGCNHLYVDENFRVPWELGAKSYRASADRGCHTDMMTQYAAEYAEVYEEGLRVYFGVE